MPNSKIVEIPHKNDHRLHAIANAADLTIMFENNGIFEIAFPEIALDAEAVVEIAQALSRLKIRQVQIIDILADELFESERSSDSGR